MKKIVVSSLFGTVILGLAGGTVASAATYPDANHANSTGTVAFTEGDTTIKDPENPDEKPSIDPEEPINTNPGDLKIVYVSDFNFGSHKRTMEAMTLNPLPDKVRLSSDPNEPDKYYKVPSFVATSDVRTTRTNWTLSVKASEFTSGTGNDKLTLNGAYVSLSNLAYKDGEDTLKPTPTTGVVPLNPGESKVVSTASQAGANRGIGSWSLAMGSLQGTGEEQKVNGVALNIPANTPKSVNTYTSTFEWTLTADPSAPEE